MKRIFVMPEIKSIRLRDNILAGSSLPACMENVGCHEFKDVCFDMCGPFGPCEVVSGGNSRSRNLTF